jgi:hypothetical protein
VRDAFGPEEATQACLVTDPDPGEAGAIAQLD